MNIGGGYMLYVYDDINDIPDDKTFIKNVEAWFHMPATRSKELDVILRDIEQASYFSDRYFTDRFGGNLYWSALSTGTKAAILVFDRQDYVVNTIECGWNVFECLLRNNISGSIFVHDISIITSQQCVDCDISIVYRGNTFNSISELVKW